MTMRVPYERSRGRRGYWLLDLYIGGRCERYTSAPHQLEVVERELSPSAEVTRVYRPGLADLQVRIAGSVDSQAVEITDRSVDWAELFARGDVVDRQRAVLRWWYNPGDEGDAVTTPTRDLTTAVTVLDGLATEPEFGAPDAPARLVFTLEGEAIDGLRLYPGPQAVADATTWVDDRVAPQTEVVDAAIIGATYPTVFGYPGAGDEDLLATYTLMPATPGLAVKINGTPSSIIVICIGEVEAQKVYVWDANHPLITGGDYFTAEEWTTATTTDRLGRTLTYAVVRTVPATNHILDEGGKWFISWNNASGYGGGMKKPGGSTAIRKLGDVMSWVLGKSTGRRVDLQAQAAEAARLNAYNIDGCLNAQVDLIDWAETNLVPLFPMRRVKSSRGTYFRFVNWWATAVDAVANLSTADQRVVRTSSVRSSRAELANIFTLEYQKNAITGAYYSRRSLAPEHEEIEPSLTADSRVIGSPLLRRSQRLYGTIERPPRKTDWTWSHTTANAILHYWATRDAFPHRFVSYAGPDLGYLLTGDVVTITDDEVGLSNAVALVNAVRFGGRVVEIELQLLDHEIRATA